MANGSRYGFDVIAITALPGGTVYPALRRLEDAGFLTSNWEKESVATAEARPPRKYYDVTRAGRAELADAVKRSPLIETPMYQMLRDHAALAGLAAYLQRPFSLAVDGGESSRIVGQVVSGNYFDVLGVRPALGRFLLPEEDATPETHPVTVIGHGLWRRSFGADVNAIGKAITLNGCRYTMMEEQKNGSPAACAIPAWRAARVDPMTSLRAD